ncbi:hypothetical protein [Nocardia sp. CDC160]|uniref:hypothetical protein n=1 Tax=Nocardia sp. CDC160 TaxID=3112166 RepID=UPI002DBBF4D9|nr:hypothetical protein [Nocardia sp. CDC160]MEC3915406.1 hypothetical protein [Nocardia sp. CDC160]
MADLTIEVPEELRQRLAQLANERGQSIEAYLLDLITVEASRTDSLVALKRFSPPGGFPMPHA